MMSTGFSTSTKRRSQRPAASSVSETVYDEVVEAPGEGIDRVEVQRVANGLLLRTSYTLPENVENGTVGGVGDFNLTGNELANELTGNANTNTLRGAGGDDTLKGAGGFDTLVGGAGNDSYELLDVTTRFVSGPISFFETVYDDVIEVADEGVDTVEVQRVSGFNNPIRYTLPDNIDNGTIVGIEEFDLTGNELNNVLVGNGAENGLTGREGKDTLNGGADYDLLRGGTDDDVYELFDVTTQQFHTPSGFSFVDTRYDQVVEAADEGIDTVRVRRAADGSEERTAYTLPDNVENANMLGAGNFDVTGNKLANNILGNGGENSLSGGGGGDTLKGAGGFDTLIGGAGDDFYDLTDVTTTLFHGPFGISFFDTVYDDVVEATDEGTDTVRVQRAFDWDAGEDSV